MKKELQDYVWKHCLPKEFKEEVKKIYSHNPGSKPMPENTSRGKSILRDIFGHDNLTSDAEGEEMLTVKASTVKDIYNSMNKAHPKENAWVVKQTLEALFGSKCLPDNVDSLHGNVDSLEHLEPKANSDYTPIPEKTVISKWDKTEPKPAEPKFKVGDRVVCLNYPHVWRLVTAIMEDGNYVLDGAIYDVKEFDLEPYTEPEEETLPNVNNSDIDIAELVAKGYLPDPAKHFDNILKDSFSKERRLNIAVQLTHAMFANPSTIKFFTHAELVQKAVEAADALIAECNSPIN